MQHLKIKLDMSTAFHPQTDGSTEIANKTIIQILRNWVSTKQDNWAQHLPLVAYAINISTNDTTKMSPFYLRFGRQPKFLPDPYIKTSVPATDEFLDALLTIQYMASKAIIESRSSQETYANRRRRPSPEYDPGQLVMLNMKNIKRKTSVRSKLQSPWEGPFEILVSWLSIDNIKLQLSPDWKIHNIFHTSLIKLYHSNNDKRFPSWKHTKPPPIPEADP